MLFSMTWQEFPATLWNAASTFTVVSIVANNAKPYALYSKMPFDSHIHCLVLGVTCAASDQVLGNYYSVSEQVEADPWIPELDVSYSSNEKGEGKG